MDMTNIIAWIVFGLLCGWVIFDMYDMRRETMATKAALSELKKKEVSKIASLNPVELDTYLETIFSMLTQMNISTYISNNDPNMYAELYARALVDFTNYLGDNWGAIEFYYGSGYPNRWFDNRFKILLIDGTIDKWINNPLYAKGSSSAFGKGIDPAALNALMQMMNEASKKK